MAIHIQWKQGYRAKCNAEEAYAELQDIRKQEGEISPAAVVARAKDKDNVLHPAIYDRKPKEAAEQYYLENARKMARSIQIIRPEKPKTMGPAYVSVSRVKPSEEDKGNVYVDVAEALKDPIRRDEILGNAIRDALAFRRKYSELQELSQVIAAVDKLVEEFDLTKAG